jgi:hypothetical protein
VFPLSRKEAGQLVEVLHVVLSRDDVRDAWDEKQQSYLAALMLDLQTYSLKNDRE